MTLEFLIKEFQISWGGAVEDTHRQDKVFIMGRRRANGRVELLPVVKMSTFVATENLRTHSFFMEGYSTCMRPTPKGWKRHQGILLVPA